MPILIDKWIYKRSVVSSGINNEPYWEKFVLASNERAGYKIEEYWITGYKKKPEKTDKYSIGGNLWNEIKVGETYKIKTSVGKLILITQKE